MIRPRARAAGRGTVADATVPSAGAASGQRQAVPRAAQNGRRGLMRLSWNEVRARAATFAED